MRPGTEASSEMPRTSCSPAVPVFLPALGGGQELYSVGYEAAAPIGREDLECRFPSSLGTEDARMTPL